MLLIAKKVFIVLALATTTLVVVETSLPSQDRDVTPVENNIVDDLLFESSRYTHPDDLSIVDPDDYVSINRNDQEILENNEYKMYFNEENLGIKVLNKSTNYVWSTAVDNANAGTFTGLLESGIGFEYYSVQQNYNNPKNIGVTDTQFRIETTVEDQTLKVDLTIDGTCGTRLCSRYFDRYLAGEIPLDQMIEEYSYSVLNLGFSFEVTLTDQGIEFFMPVDSIVEGNPEEIVLSSVIVFPGLGATYLDDIPGYMMIPDGAGTLIRYEDNQRRFVSPYESRYYGSDFGLSTRISSLNQYRLSLPIFGAVHGVNQNGFLGMIESGASNARLIAFPNGATNVDYNLIYNKFDFKQTYTQSFTQDRSGGALRVYESQDQDILVRYDFLENEEANYVGMARKYQDVLVEDGIFDELNMGADQIPIHLQYLMADSRSRFIGREIVEMTNLDQLESMYDYFMMQGLEEQRVSLLGWNDGGYSGHLPSDVDFENKLGRNREFEALIEKIEAENELLLVNNYVIGSNNSDGLNYGQDVAEAVDRFKMELTCDTCVYKDTYLLYPEFSKNSAIDALNDYKDLGVEVLFQSLGSMLFTYFDGEIYTRKEAQDIYKEVIEAYQGYGEFLQPNDYAFLGIDAYYDMPLFNNQYAYFDDLVPVLPIVMSGYVEMYSQYMNFNSMGRSQLLRLIDFNIYPSYLLTDQRPSTLAGTDVEYFYTSEFEIWKETILEEYEWINDALSQVQGQQVVSRFVPDQGIVVVEYTNGVEILINYTNEPYLYDGSIIQALNYVVRGA